jgi:nucleoside triphosphate diphosphatase
MDVERLLAIMAALRDPEGGCPWDLEQSFATIAPYTIEEAYEVDDAIRRADWDALRDELGDLLLQVVFHAQMAEEAGYFAFGDVVASICDKLVRRHPHVFGDAEIATAAAQTDAWEAQKRAERAARGETGALDGVPRSLPALLRARKLQSRAARAGAPEPDVAGAVAQVAGRLASLREVLSSGDGARSAGVGTLLFAVVALARAAGVEPEDALRKAAAEFESEWRARSGPD